VRSLLLLVVLMPTVGMIALVALSATTDISARDASLRVQAKADTLTAIVDARIAVVGEQSLSGTLAVVASLGIDPAVLTEQYGVDYRAEVLVARATVDANPTLEAMPEIASYLSRLRHLRGALDAGTATTAEVHTVFTDVTTRLDDAWRDHLSEVDTELATVALLGSIHDRRDAVELTFESLFWGMRRATIVIDILGGQSEPGRAAQLIDAAGRQHAASEDAASLLGPRARAIWERHEANPGTARVEQAFDDIAQGLLSGTTASVLSDPAAFERAFVDGAPWMADLADLVQAASADLREQATSEEQEASTAVRDRVGLGGVLAVLAVTSALLLARGVTRPIGRLEAAAREIHDGRFDIEPIKAGGPRELSDTASAFNEMATTLAAVESHAIALVDDTDAPFLDDQLPGRTGRALQVALDRLRASIRAAEEHRRELHEMATHDGLTGLLNHTAALAMLDRDLASAERAGGRTMALFIDLDGLKSLNDEHGHAVGDEALRRTADALRACTRDADVVARIGGDEFLVAGVARGRVEVEALAERIRATMAVQVLGTPTGRVTLSCSIGMALCSPGVETADALIRRADAAVYVAKRRGRNQAAWDLLVA
jgi:diguanylate cyclase (GGDEF)-like protein